jgi:hypothetical protein
MFSEQTEPTGVLNYSRENYVILISKEPLPIPDEDKDSIVPLTEVEIRDHLYALKNQGLTYADTPIHITESIFGNSVISKNPEEIQYYYKLKCEKPSTFFKVSE